jgi:hypothetical protein
MGMPVRDAGVEGGELTHRLAALLGSDMKIVSITKNAKLKKNDEGYWLLIESSAGMKQNAP